MKSELPKLSLKQGLKIWQDQQAKKPIKDNHIDNSDLQRYALAAGLDGVSEADIDHLAQCPVCLKKWSDLIIKQRTLDNSAADDWYSGGIAEAAASDNDFSQQSYKSSCGNFLLQIFPDRQDQPSAMITLELIRPEKLAHFDNLNVIIRDKNSTTLLSGILRTGKTAAMIDDITQFDMSTWSMVLKQKETE